MKIAAPKIEDLLELNSNWLSKNGLLELGRHSISWSNAFGKTSVGIISREENIELCYKTPFGDITQRVEIEWAKCGVGGQRVYVRCPKCEKRCYKLFLHEYRWVCNNCTGLLYSTQIEDKVDRALRKSKKLRERLGAPMTTGTPVERPKGMHWHTFFRLWGKLIQEEEKALVVELDRLSSDKI